MRRVTIVTDNEYTKIYRDVTGIMERDSFVELRQGQIIHWINKIDISSIIIEPQQIKTVEEIIKAFKNIKHGTD